MENNIFNQIEKHDIISFDIFDTLVVRNVLKPSDIFTLTEKKYNTLHKNSPINNFKEKRIGAEKISRSNKKNEITINDIYCQIEYPDQIKNELMMIEIDVEFKYIVKNPNIYPLYQYAKEKGKKIIIASDMYLSKEFISRVLKNCGIDTYDTLFISSEIGYRKKTGDLFAYICNYLKCNPNNILHIGDNKISDFYMALKNGLDAFLIYPSMENMYHLKKGKFDYCPIQYNVAASIIRNYSLSKKPCEKIGCQILGLPLVGFCQWVHKNTHGIDKFFFGSRWLFNKKSI